MRPSALVEVSTNQMLPSGCAMVARGWLSWLGIGNSVTLPSMVDAADAIAGGLAEPQRAVALGERQRLAAGRDAVLEFGDRAVRRDAADLAHVALGEPDVAVGPEQDAVGPGVRRRQLEIR